MEKNNQWWCICSPLYVFHLCLMSVVRMDIHQPLLCVRINSREVKQLRSNTCNGDKIHPMEIKCAT